MVDIRLLFILIVMVNFLRITVLDEILKKPHLKLPAENGTNAMRPTCRQNKDAASISCHVPDRFLNPIRDTCSPIAG